MNALARVFKSLAYDGAVQLDEVERIVDDSGRLFSRLDPVAGEVLTRLGHAAMEGVDADSLIEQNGLPAEMKIQLLTIHNSFS